MHVEPVVLHRRQSQQCLVKGAHELLPRLLHLRALLIVDDAAARTAENASAVAGYLRSLESLPFPRKLLVDLSARTYLVDAEAHGHIARPER